MDVCERLSALTTTLENAHHGELHSRGQFHLALLDFLISWPMFFLHCNSSFPVPQRIATLP
jgi:hypothetical protein